MTGSPGEMPFLDHLEELRWRILRSLAAIVVGFGLGLWLVQRFQLVNLLKQPIAPYLTGAGGKLIVTSPTEPVMIVFKLGFIVGLVLASPVILWQLWAFLAPALYSREKRALVPALFVGLVLFLIGAGAAYVFVVPQALRVLFSFQTEAIQPFITYDAYFDFVLQVVLALGLSFELPLVIVILAWLEVISPADLARFRRFAVVAAFIAGAILSPGTDLVSMIMMTIPLLLLYEVGYAGAVVIHRRRRKAAVRRHWCCWGSASASRAPRPRCRQSRGRGRCGRPCRIRFRTPSAGKSRVSRWTARPRGGSASPRDRAGASRRMIPSSRTSRRATAISRHDIAPIPRPCSSRTSGFCCKARR